MYVRQPVVAGQFYPADPVRCAGQIKDCLPDDLPDDLPERIVGGIVPHAGWVYSGPTAAMTLAAIRARSAPETLVVFSAMHRWGAARPAVFDSGAWYTPLGPVLVDEDLAQAVLAEGAGTLIREPNAHAGEHSAEVQMPFIRHLCPDALVLPILGPPEEEAVAAGEAVARAVAQTGRQAVVIGTTDLTHYGATYYGFAPAGTGQTALEWVQANDQRIIDLMLDMEAEKVVPEASAHHNACGSGAVAAAIAAARAMGAARGVLLEYTTSYHVRPQGKPTDFVGYAAVVFGSVG